MPGLGLVGVYDIAAIRNLRWQQAPQQSRRSWRSGHVSFDYGVNVVEFGSGLGVDDASGIRHGIEAAAGSRIRTGAASTDEPGALYIVLCAFALPLSADEWGSFDLVHTRFLLEHVSNPLGVVQQMVKALRPGDRIVLLDDDHDLLRFWPEPPGLALAWQAYFESYRTIGNDPLISRKLPQLLQQAGAEPRRIDTVFFGACAGEPAFQGILDNILGVLSGARETVLAAGKLTADDYDQAFRGLQCYGAEPGASVWYVINFAEGVKPGPDP